MDNRTKLIAIGSLIGIGISAIITSKSVKKLNDEADELVKESTDKLMDEVKKDQEDYVRSAFSKYYQQE